MELWPDLLDIPAGHEAFLLRELLVPWGVAGAEVGLHQVRRHLLHGRIHPRVGGSTHAEHLDRQVDG